MFQSLLENYIEFLLINLNDLYVMGYAFSWIFEY